MRSYVLLGAMAGVAALTWVVSTGAQDTASGRLVIRVPADARVFFNGNPTRQTGTRRVFSTPGLTPGRDHVYEVRAEVVRNGQVRRETREVTIRSGQTVEVNFGDLRAARPVAAHALEQFNQARQMICVWRPGQDKVAIAALQGLGLQVVFRPPNEAFAACRWEGKLTREQLQRIKGSPPIVDVEPDVEVAFADEPAAESPKVTAEVLNAYEHAGRMICVWKKGKADQAKEVVKGLGLKIAFAPPNEPYISCSWAPPLRKEVLEALVKSPALDYIEPDEPVQAAEAAPGRFIELPQGKAKAIRLGNRLLAEPEDPDLARQWGMKNIQATQAWSRANSTSARVAVIDTGIDHEHPDLKPNVWVNTAEVPGNGKDDDGNGHVDDYFGQDYTVLKDGAPTGDPADGHGHGSHVAGIIGAVGNNRVGVTGVNWRAQLMALKVFDNSGRAANASALAAALGYAIRQKAKVINLSLRWGVEVNLLQRKIDEAEKAGILVVCAAGNLQIGQEAKARDIDAAAGHAVYPVAFPNANIIGVANITQTNRLNGGSYFGAKSVDLGAPGTDIWSTFPTGKGSYQSLSGTSMAAPHVAGAVALTWGQKAYAKLDYRQIKQLVLDRARPLDDLKGKCVTGGTLDIGFLGAQSPPPDKPLPPQEVIVPPPPKVHSPAPPRKKASYRLRCGK